MEREGGIVTVTLPSGGKASINTEQLVRSASALHDFTLLSVTGAVSSGRLTVVSQTVDCGEDAASGPLKEIVTRTAGAIRTF